MIWIFVTAPDISPSQRDELEEEIKKALEDPDYSLILNFEVSVVKAQPGDIITADNCSHDQINWLREEIDKQLQTDSPVVVVTNFEVGVSSLGLTPTSTKPLL